MQLNRWKLVYLLLLLGLNACGKTADLDAPCPDYGRFCAQSPVNEDNEQ
jgi:hypothetical protein